jgi:hypothetical protein
MPKLRILIKRQLGAYLVLLEMLWQSNAILHIRDQAQPFVGQMAPSVL